MLVHFTAIEAGQGQNVKFGRMKLVLGKPLTLARSMRDRGTKEQLSVLLIKGS